MKEQMLRRLEESLAQLAPSSPAGLYDPMRYALGMGGKRMRPLLLLQAYSMYRIDWEEALPVAVGLETYHNHTLLHDDVMDRALVRRGEPTVWKKWNENTAILSGDVMLIEAMAQVAKARGPHAKEVVALCSRTMREICEGQQYDMDFEQRNNVSVAEYMEMIRLKTAVLLACALQCGAMLADAPESHWQSLYDLGIHLGLAFQLQDDYLDCYGNSDIFGKAIGGDIREGKKTFLLINAFERADSVQRTELQRLLCDEADDEAKVKGVLALYNELHIADLCTDEINRLFDAAHSDMEQLPVDSSAKAVLWQYVESLWGRKA